MKDDVHRTSSSLSPACQQRGSMFCPHWGMILRAPTNMEMTMTNIRTLAFAGLTLVASAGAAFAATHAYPAQADQYQSYYQEQNAAFPGNNSMSDDQLRNTASCYHGVYPFIVQGCGK
jgi:hypothetical protein